MKSSQHSKVKGPTLSNASGGRCSAKNLERQKEPASICDIGNHWTKSTKADADDVNRALSVLQNHTRLSNLIDAAQSLNATNKISNGIAHDFNNLLQTALSGLSILQSYMTAGRVSEIPTIIQRTEATLRRAGMLTKRLLSSSTSRQTNVRSVVVNEVVKEMEGVFRLTVGPSIDLRLCLTSDDTVIACDLVSLENAILNLVKNSCSAMKKGGSLEVLTSIELKADNSESSGYRRHVGICVSDTGSGMSSETAASAFDPFFTVGPPGSGFGLGLFNVRTFVDDLRGSAEIQSAIGRGTSVRMYLPAATDN